MSEVPKVLVTYVGTLIPLVLPITHPHPTRTRTHTHTCIHTYTHAYTRTRTHTAVIDADPTGNVSSVPFSSLTPANETLEAVGCRDPPQTWCSEVPRIYFAQLMVSLIIITPGYASTSVTIFTIYSKILGPVRQVRLELHAQPVRPLD